MPGQQCSTKPFLQMRYAITVSQDVY